MNQDPSIIYAPVSLGELVDKITILEIKKENITDTVKLGHIIKELELLKELIPKDLRQQEGFIVLQSQIKNINLSIWKSEDVLHELKGKENCDAEYLPQTRNTHTMNEERFKTKKAINLLGGSYIQEQKSYN